MRLVKTDSGSPMDGEPLWGADGAGFEPAVHLSIYAALAKRCLQPLGHPSGVLVLSSSVCSTTDARASTCEKVRESGDFVGHEG